MFARTQAWKTLFILAALLSSGAKAQEFDAPVSKDKTHTFDLASYFHTFPLQKGDEKYASIDGKRMMRWVEEQIAFSHQSRDAGNLIWGRIAGEKYDAMTHDWAAENFKKFGLSNVHLQEIDLPPQWRATTATVVARGSGKTLQPQSVFPGTSSKGTPPGGLDLDVVWVGLGTEADFAGRDVKGKAVIIYSWPNSAPHGTSARLLGAMDRAAKYGAAAVLINRGVPGNIKVVYLSAPVPTMYIGTDDTTALRGLIEQGPVKIYFDLQVETVTGLKDANVWGTLPGTTNEEIFIKAHHDAYFDGALDNATGVSTLMALAEYFAKVPQSKRRRTIHFISVAGHHARADSLWLKDPATPIKNPALVINLEHTALLSFMSFGDTLRKTTGIDPLRWTANGSDALAKTLVDSFTSVGVTLYADMDGESAPPTAGQMSNPMRFAPAVDIIHSPQWVYHGDNDTAEFIPPSGLATAARAFAKLIDGVNKLSREEIRWDSEKASKSAAK